MDVVYHIYYNAQDTSIQADWHGQGICFVWGCVVWALNPGVFKMCLTQLILNYCLCIPLTIFINYIHYKNMGTVVYLEKTITVRRVAPVSS